MNKSLYFLFFFILGFLIEGQAQTSYTAVGIRAGTGMGLTLKHRGYNSMGAEAMVMYRREGFRLVGLLEKHFSLGKGTGSYIYFGVGGHAGYNGILSEESFTSPVAGIDFVGGFEYAPRRGNIVFGLDLKPHFKALNNWGFSGNVAGANLRVILD
ncbi:MAG: hypothetical protein AAFU33_05675 [Bacteroidota bacterium]